MLPKPGDIDPFFNHYGHLFLSYAHTKLPYVSTLAATGVLAAIRKARGRKVDALELAKTCIGLSGFWSAGILISVFALTSPPAYDQLSDENKLILASVPSIVLLAVAFNEASKFLRKK